VFLSRNRNISPQKRTKWPATISPVENPTGSAIRGALPAAGGASDRDHNAMSWSEEGCNQHGSSNDQSNCGPHEDAGSGP
jgi:hypothetical protein